MRSSSAISSAVRGRARRARDDHSTQRLAQLQARARARLPAELDDAAHLGDLGEQRPVGLGRLRPAREVHRGARRPGRGSARGGRRGTASPARSLAATARARTRACETKRRPRRRRNARASGGCTSSKGRRRTTRRRGSRSTVSVASYASPASAHELMRALDEPAIERPRPTGGPASRSASVGSKPSMLPYWTSTTVEFQNVSSLRLISCAGPEAEEQVAVGRLRAELPAHHVGAHPLERLLGVDHVPPRAVHLAPALVEHLLVAEHALVRRAVDEHDRHEELRVEPEPDLLAHLGHPVGRKPLLPVGVVGQVGARRARPRRPSRSRPASTPGSPSPASRTGRCRRRARRRRPPRRASPARRRRRSGLGRDRSRAGEARRAGRTPRSRARASSSREPITLQVPAAARIEGQRQPVVAAARDVPVAHVPQPVVHALAHVGGHPLDLRVRLEQRVPHAVDGDEPVVGEPEDERRVAAPAVRVVVEHRVPEATRKPRSDEVADDLVGRPRPSRARAASRSRRRSARPRRPGSAPAGRASARARSPRRRSPVAMCTIPVPSSSETSSQATMRCSTLAPGARLSNGPS